MKKQYGVAVTDTKAYSESAAENSTGGGAVERPLLKLDGENATLVEGMFTLPPADESEDATIVVAHRILGMLVTRDLLANLPQTMTSDRVGQLIPFFPFAYHRRFGETYTDRICPGSVRAGKCPVCNGRVELFRSDEYMVSGKISKDDIIKNGGFGTRNSALIISRVFFDDKDMGVRAWWTPVTNEQAANAKHDNFFDLVSTLMTQKKMLVGESLPVDYYSNGDGARWLVTEYVRATYQEDSKKGDQSRKNPPRPYWKLSKITPAKTITGMPKAEDIWWPEIGKAKQDGIEKFDPFKMLNFTDPAELAETSDRAVRNLLRPKASRPADRSQGDATGATGGTSEPAAHGPAPTWEQLCAMKDAELIETGTAFGGEAESLELLAKTNSRSLRMAVVKLCGVTPKRIATSVVPAEPAAGEPAVDEEQLPF